MIHRFTGHLRGNAVGYLALFIALGGSSYAAVRLTPGSVKSAAIAKRAVTHAKLARNSVTSANVAKGTLTPSDFKAGTFLQGLKGDSGDSGGEGSDGLDGLSGFKGDAGDAGPQGPQGPAGKDGNGAIAAKIRLGNTVTAPHGSSTSVPLSGGSWTQSAGQINLLAGTVTLAVPSSCTGSFGNSLVISVDGQANTFALAPIVPAGTTVTMPIVVGTMSETDGDTQHTMTASFANSCTKGGEDYAVNGAKLDVIAFG
ncbi:hypothetical protein OM076_35595 [Solirubrobacter ginsenosidimutans]|uniref:Collagen-like protein n=1 Tax=Solirubrobacter ginsenosidimutans TaxID=490573 RepID=A0A9X3S722_9ACTN|nr:hypothetical protein [Solirubrobacter ginsenosidimutans]MDA0165646.1 hypothetical protein [Solirubrobacter ginsenosidimutans]